jgi:hypothetical protein
VAAWVRCQVRSCGICGEQSGSGAGFLRVLRFHLPILIPPTALHSSSIIRGWYNRPISGRRTKWTQSHPTARNLHCGLLSGKRRRRCLKDEQIRRRRTWTELGCSLCKQYILLFIRLCENAPNICFRCLPQLRNCPICNGLFHREHNTHWKSSPDKYTLPISSK